MKLKTIFSFYSIYYKQLCDIQGSPRYSWATCRCSCRGIGGNMGDLQQCHLFWFVPYKLCTSVARLRIRKELSFPARTRVPCRKERNRRCAGLLDWRLHLRLRRKRNHFAFLCCPRSKIHRGRLRIIFQRRHSCCRVLRLPHTLSLFEDTLYPKFLANHLQ